MSDVTKLDVFKKSRAVLTHTVYCTKSFNRAYRETMGATMVNHAMRVFTLICEANPLDHQGKIDKLNEAIISARTLDGFFHAAFDTRILMGIKKKADATFLCNDLLKDLIRWKRYNQKQLRLQLGLEKPDAVTTAT